MADLARVEKNKWGYSVSQVDEFFASTKHLYEEVEPNVTQLDIQNTSFDLEKNGYDTKAVDAALRRLEDAVVDKLAVWTTTHEGEQSWVAQTEQLALTLVPRAKRDERKTFERARRFMPAYDIKQVDAFVDDIVRYVNAQLGLGVLSVSEEDAPHAGEYTSHGVEALTFTQRRGHHGYDEAQVDAFLNRVVEVLTRMEASERMAKNAAEASAEPQVAPLLIPVNDPFEQAYQQESIPSIFESLNESVSARTTRSAEHSSEFSTVSQDEEHIFSMSFPVVEPADGFQVETETSTSREQSTSPEVDMATDSAPQSFVPEHKPERGSVGSERTSVNYSGLMDTGSIRSVQFHLPKLGDDDE